MLRRRHLCRWNQGSGWRPAMQPDGPLQTAPALHALRGPPACALPSTRSSSSRQRIARSLLLGTAALGREVGGHGAPVAAGLTGHQQADQLLQLQARVLPRVLQQPRRPRLGTGPSQATTMTPEAGLGPLSPGGQTHSAAWVVGGGSYCHEAARQSPKGFYAAGGTHYRWENRTDVANF